jgi:hypothetical protein
MNLPLALLSIRLLAQDTFRQARASGLFWLMLGVSLVCRLFCLSVRVEGVAQLRYPDELPEFLPRQAAELKDPVKAATAAKTGVSVIQGDLTLGFGAVRVPVGRDAEDALHFLQVVLAGGVADGAGLLLPRNSL